MVAPNGARRGKGDHPALPIDIAEIAQTAAACAAAGADAIHAHARDKDGAHSLDVGLCRELLAAIAAAAPALAAQIQITTESAGKYEPHEQRRFLRELRPRWASVSLAEMLADNDAAAARRMYHWAAAEGVRLQHILYSPADVMRLRQCIADGVIPAGDLEALFVLGSHSPAVDGAPAMLADFLAAARLLPQPAAIMVCAFGAAETACLRAAAKAGGDCRVGFENNFRHADGRLARDNAERVAEVAAILEGL